MRRIILAGLFAAAALVLAPAAEAQVPLKISKPGYLIIRVLLDNGGGGVAPGADNPNPGAPQGRAGDPTHSVAAVVPYTSVEKMLFSPERPANRLSNPYWPAFKHKYGMLYPYTDKTFIQTFQYSNKSFEKELKDAYEKWSTKRSYDNIHDICNKALMFGQVDEAYKYCDEYVRLPEVMDRLPPTTQFTEFAKIYKVLQEKLKAPMGANESLEEWKGRIGASYVQQSQYYSILYFDANNQKEAQRRGKLLDNNFKAFYLWHALHGVGLPVPQKKLLAILAESTTQLTNFREGLDGLPVVCDAFFSPSHNILMLAPGRMDPNGMQFTNMVNARYASGWNRDELIAKKFPAIAPQVGKAEEVALHQTLAVADKYISEEADNAAISREGCRQLMAATGMLSPNVLLPLWLERGVGFFWQRAKGPLYLQNNMGKFSMSVGLVTGYGTPNFEQHRAYDTVKADFKRKPEVTIQNVILGNYYVGLVTRRDVDPRPVNPNGNPAEPPPPPPGDPNTPTSAVERRLITRLQFKADSSAWALVYYLEKTKLVGLQKFYAELAKMPRDIRIEEQTMLKLFCRSFGLLKLDGSVDVAALRVFAINWLEYMDNVPHYDYEVPLDAATLDPFANAPATTPPPQGNPPPGGNPNRPGRPGPGGGNPPPGGGNPPPPPPGG